MLSPAPTLHCQAADALQFNFAEAARKQAEQLADNWLWQVRQAGGGIMAGLMQGSGGVEGRRDLSSPAHPLPCCLLCVPRLQRRCLPCLPSRCAPLRPTTQSPVSGVEAPMWVGFWVSRECAAAL